MHPSEPGASVRSRRVAGPPSGRPRPHTMPSAATAPAASPAGSPGTDRAAGLLPDLALLTAAALLLRLPALVAGRHLTFDDGVYGASAVAMRDGGLPFRDVFSSQGPLFLPLVRVADLAGFQTLDAPRLLTVAAGVVFTLAVYLAGRELTDRSGALLAAGLATASGSLLWVTAPIASDGPALAAAAVAFWLGLRFRRAPGLGRAVGVGVAVGVGISIKLMAAPVVVPVAWLLVAPLLATLHERRRAVPNGPGVDPVGRALLAPVLAGGAAVLVWLVPSLLLGIGEVWDQSVRYHTEVSGGRDPVANLQKVASTFADRDLALLLLAAVALAAWVVGRARGPARSPSTTSAGPAPAPWWARPPDAVPLLWVWLGATVALLLYVHPLWRPHVSGLIAPVALLVGAHRPTGRLLVAAIVVVAPLGLWRVGSFLVPGPYSPSSQALLAELDRLPEGAWVLSDEPGQVWRAGRRTTDDLVDASVLRIEAGYITPESLAAEAADPRVCAVVVWSSVRFGSFPTLPDLLAPHGYREAARFDDHRVLYTRDPCDPPA